MRGLTGKHRPRVRVLRRHERLDAWGALLIAGLHAVLLHVCIHIVFEFGDVATGRELVFWLVATCTLFGALARRTAPKCAWQAYLLYLGVFVGLFLLMEEILPGILWETRISVWVVLGFESQSWRFDWVFDVAFLVGIGLLGLLECRMRHGPLILQDGTLCPRCAFSLVGHFMDAESEVLPLAVRCPECGRAVTLDEIRTTPTSLSALRRGEEHSAAAHLDADGGHVGRKATSAVVVRARPAPVATDQVSEGT